MTSYRYLRRKLSTALLITLLLVWGGYRYQIRNAIRNEERGRLSDPAVTQALADVYRTGSPEKPAILLLHGFGGSPHDLAPLIKRIPRSYTVHAPVLPGHAAASPRELCRVQPEDWAAAAHKHAEALLATHPDLYVCGFSYGGILALQLSESLPIKRLVLINPYTSIPHKPHYILTVPLWIRLFSPAIPFVPKWASGQIASPEGEASYIPSYMHLSLVAYSRMHRHTQRILANIDPPLQCRIHLHAGSHDSVSAPHRVQALAKKLRIPPENIHTWTNSNHVLLHDYDGPQAVHIITQTLTAQTE